MRPCEAGGQILFDGRHLRAHQLDHVQGVGVGQGPDAHEDGGLAGKTHLVVVILGPQHHVADVGQADDGPVLFPDHQPLEFLHRTQIGIGGEVDLDERTLGVAEGGQVVVGGQRLAHLGRADVVGGHAFGFEPDAHGKGAAAEDVGALHAFDGGKAGLHHPGQIIGDLVLAQDIGGETEIGRGKLAVRRLDVDDRHLGLGRQVAGGPDRPWS